MGQPNSQPFEIIGAPFTAWIAPVGTAFPAVDEEPGEDWIKIGTSGDLNYLDEGVRISHAQAFNKFRPLGDAGVRKMFRTEEDLVVGLTLADVSLEQYKYALNSNSIGVVAAGVGTAGKKTLGLSRGLGIATMALLVRGCSPYGDDMTMQYEVPLCSQTGSPQPVYRRDQPAGLALEWTAIVDPTASTPLQRYGRLVAQTAAATE